MFSMFNNSLLKRLYTDFFIVIAVCALVINLLLNQYIKETSGKELNERLLAEANFLKELSLKTIMSASPNRVEYLREQISRLDRKNGNRLTIIDELGWVIADSRERPIYMDNHLQRPEIQESIGKSYGHAERFSHTVKQDMKYLALQIVEPNHRPEKENNKAIGFVRVALPLSEIQENQKKVTFSILAGCLLSAAIAMVLSFYFSRRFSKPIITFTETADSIAKGNFEQRISVKHKDEIGRLADSFNVMASSANTRVRNITEEKNKLMTILSGLVEGVIAIDEHQRIIHINHAAEHALSISRTSIGELVWNAIDNKDIHHILRNIFKDGGISRDQVRIPIDKKNNQQNVHKETILDVYGAALSAEQSDNKNNGAILVLNDISELEMLENIRRDFVTNASHELKTPLTAIRGIVETILLDQTMHRDTVFHFLNKVQDQTNRLVSIVSDLMTLSRLEGGKNIEFEYISIDELVQQSFQGFDNIAQEKNVGLVINSNSITTQNSQIYGDAYAITQLIDNLIDNAIKYTPAQGEVSIHLNKIDKDQKSWVQIIVSDNGMGINKNDQARIFERFYRVDKGRSRDLGGTGLGLAITKHIAEQHKGSIWVESEVGKGSKFTVMLPSEA